jgi:hypothetical protein
VRHSVNSHPVAGQRDCQEKSRSQMEAAFRNI